MAKQKREGWTAGRQADERLLRPPSWPSLCRTSIVATVALAGRMSRKRPRNHLRVFGRIDTTPIVERFVFHDVP